MTGLGTSIRLAWRRSRLYWTLWVMGLASLLPLVASNRQRVYDDSPESQAALELMAANVSTRAMIGVPHDLTTAGGYAVWDGGLYAAIFTGFMAAWGVISASRGEEEAGRTELVRAGAVSRMAPLAAAVILAVAASMAVGTFTALALAAVGLPFAGSAVAGLGLASTGVMYTGVGAMCAQIFASTRAARGWALGVGLGVMYAVRGAVDARPDLTWAQWWMPLDWANLMRPFAQERPWVAIFPLALGLTFLGLAVALERRRDLGGGLIAPRLGRASANPGLAGPFSLAFRLQRGTLLGWGLGILLSAAVYGSLTDQMLGFVEENPSMKEMLQRMSGGADGLVDLFIQAMLTMFAPVAAMAAIALLHRLWPEEESGRMGLLLSLPTRRLAVVTPHVVLSLLLGTVAMVLTGPLLHGGDMTLLKASACLVPGIVLMVGLSVFLLGWRPQWRLLAWVVASWSLLVITMGAMIDLPSWLMKVTPWAMLPHLPGASITSSGWAWMIGETGVGIVLIVLGLLGYRRRDLTTG